MNKNKFTLSLFIIVLWSCATFSQCELIPEITNHYQDQVSILALEEMLQSGSSDTNSIRILDEYTTPIYESLGSIYNSIYAQEADSVFNIYCINNSTFDEQVGYTSNEIYVHLDTAVNWTSSWLNEISYSGNNFIDSLLEGLEYDVAFHTVYI